MKSGYTHISFVLDRSGSMASIADDTIGGFNTFLGAQQALPGEATLTLVQFDNQYERLMHMAPLAEARSLTRETFVPRGSTALLDAIGRCIRETGEALAAMADDHQPEQVVFVILTDGMENASREFDNQKVADAITHQRDIYKWQFIFLGANQDAIATATKLKIDGRQALSYAASASGVSAAYRATSDVVAQARAGAPAPAFTTEDRKKQADEGA